MSGLLLAKESFDVKVVYWQWYVWRSSSNFNFDLLILAFDCSAQSGAVVVFFVYFSCV